MTDRAIHLCYAVIWGALLALDLWVTATTDVGFWGYAGLPLLAWLLVRRLRAVATPQAIAAGEGRDGS